MVTSFPGNLLYLSCSYVICSRFHKLKSIKFWMGKLCWMGWEKALLKELDEKRDLLADHDKSRWWRGKRLRKNKEVAAGLLLRFRLRTTLSLSCPSTLNFGKRHPAQASGRPEWHFLTIANLFPQHYHAKKSSDRGRTACYWSWESSEVQAFSRLLKSKRYILSWRFSSSTR